MAVDDNNQEVIPNEEPDLELGTEVQVEEQPEDNGGEPEF